MGQTDSLLKTFLSKLALSWVVLVTPVVGDASVAQVSSLQSTYKNLSENWVLAQN